MTRKINDQVAQIKPAVRSVRKCHRGENNVTREAFKDPFYN